MPPITPTRGRKADPVRYIENTGCNASNEIEVEMMVVIS
jgi:hypothetical protein